jgi:hypothetical protein
VEAPSTTMPLVVESASIQPAMGQPTPVRQRRNRPARWQWRAAVTFASVISLALLLGFGLHRSEGPSNQNAGLTSVQTIATPPADSYLLTVASAENYSADVPARPNTLTVSPAAAKPRAGTLEASNGPTVHKALAPVTKSAAIEGANSPKHSDAFIARDTITYLDERYRPAPRVYPAKQRAGGNPAHKHNGGVVAANSVIYLNKTPAAKPAK